MRIEYVKGAYIAYDVEDGAPFHKWGWTRIGHTWRTAHQSTVIPFAAWCVGAAAQRIQPLADARKDAVAASAAADSDIIVPVGKRAAAAGKDFRGYQKAGIEFVIKRKRALIGDIPRLGKMIQGIGAINTWPVGAIKRGLILSPANAKITWCQRWPEWTIHEDLAIDYCRGDECPDTPIVVCNWEILGRHIDYFMSQEWDFVIGDELHRCGGEKSAVTRYTLGPAFDTGIPARLLWLGLSGTPVGTRPINFWPICRFMDPTGLGRDKWMYRKRYCGATPENRWDSKGATNEEELQFKARKSFMIRRDMEVGGVPPNRQTVRLPKDGLSTLIRAERNAMQQRLDEFERMLAANDVLNAAHFAENDQAISAEGSALQDLALAALPMMVEFIEEQLETEQKVVVFCHHRAVAKALQAAFPGCAFVIGGLSPLQREAQRVRFQDDSKCRVFVGNIAACCENLELAAANVTVFCELIYQTGLLDQAEMRTWLPTKDVPIQVFRLTVDGSASADLADLMEARQSSIERATVARRLADVISVDRVNLSC